MIRAGLVDLDTGHVLEFTKRFNHQEIDANQWVDGVQVVAALPGEPATGWDETQVSNIEQLTRWGVRIVDSPEALMRLVDVVLIESIDGARHLASARPFLEAGMMVFIDKPLAASVADAEAIVALAERSGAKLMTGSQMRYVPEVQALHTRAAETGAIRAAVTHSPCAPLNDVPGLMNYGIHAVELLYGILGEGCVAVSSVDHGSIHAVTGKWADGRTGVVLGVQQGKSGFGFTAYCDNEVVHAQIDGRYRYRAFLRVIAEFFQSGKQPIAQAQSLEVIRFIHAALRSSDMNGREVILNDLG